MNRIFVPTNGPEDWKRVLGNPTKHWRTGFSAKALAYCWEEADGFPQEVNSLFFNSGFSAFNRLEVLLVVPEYKVPLPGGRRPSQCDVFVLAKAQQQLVCITVEGKVSEPFGPTVEEWLMDASEGKRRRLAFLMEKLELPHIPEHIRYQLLHRTASAVIEAERFGAGHAVMLVHSFSPEGEWFEDYRLFLELFDAPARPDQLTLVKRAQGSDLYCGWVRGNTRYLKA